MRYVGKLKEQVKVEEQAEEQRLCNSNNETMSKIMEICRAASIALTISTWSTVF